MPLLSSSALRRLFDVSLLKCSGTASMPHVITVKLGSQVSLVGCASAMTKRSAAMPSLTVMTCGIDAVPEINTQMIANVDFMLT